MLQSSRLEMLVIVLFSVLTIVFIIYFLRVDKILCKALCTSDLVENVLTVEDYLNFFLVTGKVYMAMHAPDSILTFFNF